jgi:hypothetical protein
MKSIKDQITEKQKENLIKDIKSGNYNIKDLAVKYNYPSTASLHGLIHWWKKQGLLDKSDKLKKLDGKKEHKVHLSKDERNELYKDHASKKYNNTELAKMYDLPNSGSVTGILTRLKRSRDFLTTSSVIDVPVKVSRLKDLNNTVSSPKPNIPVKTIVTPKGEISTIRTINFPDGFSIQIEKAFISGVLIHENGNITIIK